MGICSFWQIISRIFSCSVILGVSVERISDTGCRIIDSVAWTTPAFCAPLVLHAHDSQLYSVENDRTGRQATIAFDGLQHIIEIRGEGIHYTFEVIISDKGRPSFTMRQDGELVPGTVTQAKMLTAVHLAIDSITDLHAPI